MSGSSFAGPTSVASPASMRCPTAREMSPTAGGRRPCTGRTCNTACMTSRCPLMCEPQAPWCCCTGCRSRGSLIPQYRVGDPRSVQPPP
jgi:hypothetical protein